MKNLLCLAALALLLSAARSLLPEGGDAYGVAQTELAGVLPSWATIEGLETDYTGETHGPTTVAGPFRDLGKKRVFAL